MIVHATLFFPFREPLFKTLRGCQTVVRSVKLKCQCQNSHELLDSYINTQVLSYLYHIWRYTKTCL